MMNKDLLSHDGRLRHLPVAADVISYFSDGYFPLHIPLLFTYKPEWKLEVFCVILY